MKRRDAIVGLVVAAMLSRAHAQQPGKVYRIVLVEGHLPATEISESSSDPAVARAYGALFGELRRRGYVEGQNLVVERYSGEGRSERYAELAREVIRRNPDLINVPSPDLLLEFKAATSTIPIVAITYDPVGLGVVSNMARPGGNITGVSVDSGPEIWGKRLEFLKEAVPRLSRLGFIVTRNVAGERGGTALKDASEKLGISLVGSPLLGPPEESVYRHAFADMVKEGADAVFVGDEPEHFQNLKLIVSQAEQWRLPAVYAFREAVVIGGLMAYAFELLDLISHNAAIIDQIFKGSKPGDIPFYQARKFDLIINMKTAKTLGITMSAPLLARADEVIE
jgi:putative ABC transport system substrate-binding protein